MTLERPAAATESLRLPAQVSTFPEVRFMRSASLAAPFKAAQDGDWYGQEGETQRRQKARQGRQPPLKAGNEKVAKGRINGLLAAASRRPQTRPGPQMTPSRRLLAE